MAEYRLETPRSIRVIGVLLLLLEVAGAIILVTQVTGNPGLLIGTLAMIAVGAALATLLLTCGIRVVVTDTAIVFRFTPIYKRIIHGCEILDVEYEERVSPARFGGVGLRKAPGRITGLLWRAGPGVCVTATGGDRLVVALPEATELLTAIEGVRSANCGMD